MTARKLKPVPMSDEPVYQFYADAARMKVKQALRLFELADLIDSKPDGRAGQQQMILRIRTVLVSFVVRDDGGRVTEAEALDFIDEQTFPEIQEAIVTLMAGTSERAVPPPSGPA